MSVKSRAPDFNKRMERIAANSRGINDMDHYLHNWHSVSKLQKRLVYHLADTVGFYFSGDDHIYTEFIQRNIPFPFKKR